MPHTALRLLAPLRPLGLASGAGSCISRPTSTTSALMLSSGATTTGMLGSHITGARAHQIQVVTQAKHLDFHALGNRSFSTSLHAFGSADDQAASRLEMIMHPIKWTRRQMQRTDYAHAVYEQCSSQFDNRQDILHFLELPENFNSWFLLNILHLWIYNCRMRAEGPEAKEVMQSVFEHLWLDIELKLAEAGAKRVNGIVQRMVASYYGQFLAYDEGLYRGDAVLAAALWRNLLDADEDITPAKLEQLVIYVRRQLARISEAPTEDVIHGKFSFDGVSFPVKV